MRPKLELTTSNAPSANGSAWASPSTHSMAELFDRACSSSLGAMSRPVTSAPARAARRATSPVPVATSSQRSPARGASSRPGRRGSRRIGPRRARTGRRSRALRSSFLVRELGQPVPRLPELREELLLDQPAEQLHGRSLGADHLVADDPRDHLVVPHSPKRQPFVPVDQALRELVELLVLASLHVEVDEAETAFPQKPREFLP